MQFYAVRSYLSILNSFFRATQKLTPPTPFKSSFKSINFVQQKENAQF